MDRDDVKRRFLTVQEVSDYLNVCRATVYKMLKRRQIPAFRVGSDWRFRIEAIDQWLMGSESGGLGTNNNRVGK